MGGGFNTGPPPISSGGCMFENETLFAFDTETTGLRYHNPKVQMFSFSFGLSNDKLSVNRLDGTPERRNKNKEILFQIWDDRLKRVPKSMHNAKFDVAFTEKFLGKRLDGHNIHDTALLARLLLKSRPNYKLKDIMWELAGIPKDDEEAVKKYLRGGKTNFQRVPENIMDEYQERDALRQLLLTKFLFDELEKCDQKVKDLYDIERSLVIPTLRMEQRGIMINKFEAHKLIDWMHSELKDTRRKLTSAAGLPVQTKITDNFFRWLLYTKFKMPVLKKSDKTSEPSTAKDVLLELKLYHPHPILDQVFRFRTYRDGITDIEKYIELTDSNDVIHPTINITGARTGRASCADPNLQNVPKTKVLKNPFTVPARRIFRPRPGYVNFHIDYGGEEMRLIVNYSKEPEMIEIFKVNGDAHEPAAVEFYQERYLSLKIKEPKSARTLRNAAKNAHFALCYMGGPKRIAATLNVTEAEGRAGVKRYKDRFPLNANIGKVVAEQVLQDGYIDTLFGRRIYFRKEFAHAGLNGLIQGTAADILKIAMLRVDNYLEDETKGEVGMLMQVHDELIIQFPRNMLRFFDEVMGNIVHLMTDFPELDVPLVVEIEQSTRDWETLKEVVL